MRNTDYVLQIMDDARCDRKLSHLLVLIFQGSYSVKWDFISYSILNTQYQYGKVNGRAGVSETTVNSQVSSLKSKHYDIM